MTGEVLVHFVLVDPTNPTATGEEISKKFINMFGISPGLEGEDDDDTLDRMESMGLEGQYDDEDMSEIEDPTKPEAVEKRKRRLRLAKLKRKAKLRAYEFSDKSEVAGVLFLEIVKITDLPPEKNSKKQCMTPLHDPN